MIQVTPHITIHENEISFDFVRASGPGGQHVNKVATAVQLRYNAKGLPADVYKRLKSLAGKRMNASGEILIQARRFKSQERNRQDALDRLVALIRKAAQKPKKRRKTKPTLASKERTLAAKQHRSRIKQSRKRVSTSDY
jgi:ribosome-associated protein